MNHYPKHVCKELKCINGTHMLASCCLMMKISSIDSSFHVPDEKLDECINAKVFKHYDKFKKIL